MTLQKTAAMSNTAKLLEETRSDFAAAKKEDALELFRSLPMPHEKDESFRYTQIGKLKLSGFEPFATSAKITVSELGADLIKQGVVFTDINSALEKYPAAQNYFRSIKAGKDKFTALCASNFANGVFIYVPKNVEIAEPLRARFEVSGNAVLYNLIVSEQNTKLDYIEEYSNADSGAEQLNCVLTEVYANNNADVNFHHINNFGSQMSNVTNIIGALERNARINWISACFGGKLNRVRIDTLFSGIGSNCNNVGIFLGKGKEHIDFTTNVYHNAENTTNDILVDGILKGESSSVYRGLIKIAKEGQRTNSYLSSHILKLGEKTLANSIPSLKIDANDVKASHGATVGQINDEHLFYMMARGLSKDDAEKLIVEGFFEPIIQRIPSEELREKIRGMVRK